MQSHGLGHEVESYGEVVVNEVVAEVFKERPRSVFDVEFSANFGAESGVEFSAKFDTIFDAAFGTELGAELVA